MKNMIIGLGAAIISTGCSAQHITCWSEATGQINYIGGFDNVTSYNEEV